MTQKKISGSRIKKKVCVAMSKALMSFEFYYFYFINVVKKILPFRFIKFFPQDQDSCLSE